MEDIKVTITNPDGNFAVFVGGPSEVVELERYDTQEEAVAALTALLGASPGRYTVVDRKARDEVYAVNWLGAEKPAPAAKK